MQFNFDNVTNRMGTNSIKWEFINKGKNNDLLPLWLADMDFPTPEPILKALHDRIDKQILGYSVPMDDYYSSVQNWFLRRFNWEIKQEEILKSPGVVPALGILIKAFTNAGDGIIIQTPAYQPFTFLVEKNNRKILNNTLINKGGKYFIDFDDLEQKAKEKTTTMMILCSPHNPTGRVWTRGELKRIIEICIQNDVMIISDEIHCDLLRNGVTHYPLASLSDNENIIVCTAPSKTFNIAGLQMANIIIKNSEMREIWIEEFIQRSGLLGTNPISISGVTAAYDKCDLWLDELNSYVETNLVFVDSYLKQYLPKATFTIPEGTFFAWIDFNRYIGDSKELEDLMINKAGVALSEGYTFGEEGRGFERINVACPKSILEQGLDKIRDAIVQHKNNGCGKDSE